MVYSTYLLTHNDIYKNIWNAEMAVSSTAAQKVIDELEDAPYVDSVFILFR
ncbi:hypothetical protein GCM10008018_20930 [Paenibacillus marchantiophytorum]|uniref:Uncharacterized protein n=1 Tax=Paenibacillus marchantiophytorum TaxID=1619310 RepID=A0ABQ1EK22_9BACL|nr:hypothetical protein GCM10008018_20930 [Paenibacillus marchantiophytorum]